ncbi:MAG: MBL fold metallo-hydrolase [Rhodospirillales bacterium]
MNRFYPVSGVGDKAAACFCLEARGKRLLLDLGEGPAPGQMPDVGDIGAVDAVLISHTHRDHVGGFPLLERLGNPPVFATAGAFSLMDGDFTRGGLLPAQGGTDVLGLRVSTGRTGHAPGGVWIHVDTGGGVLYCGDLCMESPLYVYDPPPLARIVVLDASYGLDETPQAERIAALRPLIEGGGLLLPIPADGRGPEIAVHLMQAGSRIPAMDTAMKAMIANLLTDNRGYVLDGAIPALERLQREAKTPGDPNDITLAASASLLSGESARLAAAWESEKQPAIAFTGFMPPGSPARRLVEKKRAQFLRWNVHPRLSDNVALVTQTGAGVVMPAFSDAGSNAPGWREAFAPAEVVLGPSVPL